MMGVIRINHHVTKIGGLGIVAASMLSGCGKAKLGKEESNLKITNGITIEEATFPAVVLLVVQTENGPKICSGTFVNDHQLLTAAHCFKDIDGSSSRNIFYATVDSDQTTNQSKVRYIAQALDVYIHPDYKGFEEGKPAANDLAVVQFPFGVAPGIAALGNNPPQSEDEVTIVGFGDSESFINDLGVQTGAGAGQKRFGENIVSDRLNDMIRFYGLNQASASYASGQWSATGAGDSGGPMFLDGQLAGITSGGELEETAQGSYIAVSYFVDINLPTNKAFLAEVLD